jgi:hypothetical protein
MLSTSCASRSMKMSSTSRILAKENDQVLPAVKYSKD